MHSTTTTRYFGRKLCNEVEDKLGFRITDAVIEKQKGQPIKVVSINVSKKNQK